MRRSLATEALRFRHRAFALLIGFLFLAAGFHAANAQSSSAPVLVLPAQATRVALQTHTSDITLDGAGAASVSAFYRLRNEGSEPAVMSLLFTAPAGTATASLPADLEATAGGEALSLQSVDSGAQALVTVPAAGRLDLRLRYSLNLSGSAVQGVQYPAKALDGWPGEASFRLTVNVPASVPRESWLRIAPEGWRFGVTDGEVAAAVQWLYEGNLPSDPLVFEYVAPALWQEITVRRAAAAGGALAEYVALGESYARLASEAADAGVRDRYYGQALAAYSTALDRGAVAGQTPAELAPAYAGQAALYRKRILTAGGAVSPEHAQLLVESVAKALDGLAPDNAARGELQQWFNDGLAIVLGDARARRDWGAALDTLELLAAAGNGIDQASIEEERKRILFEQSLQLLEEGQRDQAVAVSGSGIVGEELQPSSEVQALFTSWQNTMTVKMGGVELVFTGVPVGGRELAAADAAVRVGEAMNEATATSGGSVQVTAPTPEQPDVPVVFRIRLPAEAQAASVANVIPLRPDWTLLRTLLTQVAPENKSSGGFLRHALLLRLGLDLRSAGEEWRRLASDLSVGAETLEAQSEPANRMESASLEAALRTRIQAANYRAEAGHWASLIDNSQLVVLLEGPRGAPSDARAWQVTVEDPPQTLQYATWGLNYGAVLAVVGGVLALIMLVAAVLWMLL